MADRASDHPGELRRKQRQADGTPEGGFSIEHIGRLIVVEGELDKMACNQVLSPRWHVLNAAVLAVAPLHCLAGAWVCYGRLTVLPGCRRGCGMWSAFRTGLRVV